MLGQSMGHIDRKAVAVIIFINRVSRWCIITAKLEVQILGGGDRC